MPCPDCNAGGVVDKETGDPLPAEELVIQLRLWLAKAMETNRQLRAQIKQNRPQEDNRGYGEGRGHGPMGMKYHGD